MFQAAREKSTTRRYFPQLRDWISKFLEFNMDMTASLIGHYMLVEQVSEWWAGRYIYPVFDNSLNSDQSCILRW